MEELKAWLGGLELLTILVLPSIIVSPFMLIVETVRLIASLLGIR